MREVIRGTYTSLIFSMLFALAVLAMTSGNLLITLYAMITITFIIADTIAIFVLCGWELSILETIIIIMSVGLSVDFSKDPCSLLSTRESLIHVFILSFAAVHYGVAYIKANVTRNQSHIRRPSQVLRLNHETDRSPIGEMTLQSTPERNTNPRNEGLSIFGRLKRWHRKGNLQRFRRVKTSLIRVGSAVFVAALTSFLAGLSMAPSKLTSFSQMGFFLMLIMFVSWLYATWFFLPLLSFLGPMDSVGDMR